MQRITNMLQRLCGISSIRYKGALGHVYYVNDLAGIIAQVRRSSLIYLIARQIDWIVVIGDGQPASTPPSSFPARGFG